jgi:hypothetical protein
VTLASGRSVSLACGLALPCYRFCPTMEGVQACMEQCIGRAIRRTNPAIASDAKGWSSSNKPDGGPAESVLSTVREPLVDVYTLSKYALSSCGLVLLSRRGYQYR